MSKRKPVTCKLLLSFSRGQILALTGLAIVATLAIAAFAVDVGLLWNTRRHMQAAADAGAIAGVYDIIAQTSTTQMATDAKLAAQNNGFQDGHSNIAGSGNVTVTPAKTTFNGSGNSYQVSISQSQPTQFLQLVGYSSIPVSVTAIATIQNGGSCVYGLDPTNPKTVSISGTTNFSSSCGIYDNSTNSGDALDIGGNPTVSAPVMGVVGGSNYHGSLSAPTATGIAAFKDPLAYISAPSYTDKCSGSFKNTALATGTYSSQEWCGGISVNSGTTVTFNPGLYVINGGGITLNGGTISGSNVTFYLTGQNSNGNAAKVYSGVSVNGNATVNLTAPCSGASSTMGNSLTGILFFQDRSINSTATNGSTINGTSTSTYDGALYFSTTALSFTGNTSANGYIYLVSDTLSLSGNSTLKANYTCLSGGSLIKNVALVQ